MPEIREGNPGEWKSLGCTIRTGNSVADLRDSLLEVQICQSVLQPFETGIFYISNDASIYNTLPIIIGSVIVFNYEISGLKFSRSYTVVEMETMNDDMRAKQLEVRAISSEYYLAGLSKRSIAYNSITPDKIFERSVSNQNGNVSWFQLDECEGNDWVLPHGKHHGEFSSDILYTASPFSDVKSWMFRTKEGYNIASHDSFKDRFMDHYGIEGDGITITYGGDFRNELDPTGNISIGKANKIFSILDYSIIDPRSSALARSNQEFSYVVEIYDSFRKKYEEYHYQESRYTSTGQSLYLADEEKQEVNRYYRTLSSSANDDEPRAYKSLNRPTLMNRKGFSTQNTLNVTMKGSAYFEVGMIYDIIIPSDLPGNDDTILMPDPVLSGSKKCIEAKHIFNRDTSTTIMTLAGDGSIYRSSLNKDSGLAGR